MNAYDSILDKLTKAIENVYSPKAQDPNSAVMSNNKAPPLEGGNYTKNGDMCAFKHEISSPKLYELLIKT